MRKLLTSTLLLLFTAGAFAQNKYEYSVDILNIKNDQVDVSLKTPALKQETAIFSFPMAIPGSYARKDFGRFISNLKAFDKDGKPLKVTKEGKNRYIIKNATTLASITYKVDDTWDTKYDDFIFQPGGTNIDAGANVVMNNHAFYGYFEGNDKLPIEITVAKPASFYAATHLDVEHPSAEKDVIKAKNYVYLADNPVIYAKPDTTSFYVGKSKVNVSVYSASGKVKSAQIAEYLKPIASALGKFFNGLPVDSYQFLYYFQDPQIIADKSKGGGGYGALEHNFSSLYYLPERSLEKDLRTMVNEVSAHEFLHIQTPLNLHSYEIENFNFSAPVMSQHLWLYEGVTEYFAHLVQVQNGLTTEKDFFKEMRNKMNDAVEFGDFSMTEMSKRVMEDAFQKKYGSVYNKGALIAFMLDVFIRDKTNGAKDLKSVIGTLTKKYGANRPFEDNQLFADFVAASHPDVKQFIDAYIVGAQPLPYQTLFEKFGYEYLPKKKIEVYYIGRLGLKFDDPSHSFVFEEVEKNALDIKSGDIFKSVDGVAVTGDTIDEIVDQYFRTNLTHPEMDVVVVRDGKEVRLKNRLYDGVSEKTNYIGPLSTQTPQQLQLLNALMGRN